MASFSEIAHKKVAGIPVLYLAGGGAVILAVVAYRLKPSATTDTQGAADAGTDTQAADEAVQAAADGDYSALATQGTVTVVQSQSATEVDNVKYHNNGEWVKAGGEWLVANKGATGTAASAALSKGIDGAALTYDEGQLLNALIAEGGQPPDGFSSGTSTIATDKPAQRQFTNFPGTHTVKGYNDNTPSELSYLYYGKGDSKYLDLIRAANPSHPPNATWQIGEKVAIPAFREPAYYTTTVANQTMADIAKKNGITSTQLQLLNPSIVFPKPKGTKVRVH